MTFFSSCFSIGHSLTWCVILQTQALPCFLVVWQSHPNRAAGQPMRQWRLIFKFSCHYHQISISWFHKFQNIKNRCVLERTFHELQFETLLSALAQILWKLCQEEGIFHFWRPPSTILWYLIQENQIRSDFESTQGNSVSTYSPKYNQGIAR